MKINLTIDKIDEVGEACDDAEATELVLDDVVSYVRADSLQEFLQTCMRKIRIGGTIVLTGADAYDVVRCFHTNIINLTELNVLLYGEDSNKKSILSGYEVADMLRASSFKILKNDIINLKYVVVAERIV